MKFHYKAPKPEDVLVVKPDNEGDEYEIWHVQATRIGTAVKAGERRIVCDGHHFSNIAAAIKHCLERAGNPALAAKQNLWMRKGQDKVSVTGLELVKKQVWEKFCASQKLDADEFLSKPKKTYLLSQAEAEKLGLKEAN